MPLFLQAFLLINVVERVVIIVLKIFNTNFRSFGFRYSECYLIYSLSNHVANETFSVQRQRPDSESKRPFYPVGQFAKISTGH